MTTLEYDIIILALPRWDGLYSSTAYSLAKELSLHTRVFYVDNPFTFKDFFWHRNSGQIVNRKEALLSGRNCFVNPEKDYPALTCATPQLVYPINWLPPGKMYDRLAGVNDKIVFRLITKMVEEFKIKKFIFINSFNPIYGRFFPDNFSPALKIYHCVDDISKSEYISRHGTYLETRAIDEANLTLTTSMELKRLASRHSSSVYYLPNAADVALFQRALTDLPVPQELINIPKGKKVIFYMGNICRRIDYDLLVRIAASPDYFLVMTGPLTYDIYREAGLDKLENVLFTGPKKLDELPAYVRQSHCCIIPFLCNTLTKSIYPLKINEYLSAGKPVVTTNFSEDIATFGEVANVCDTGEAFLAGIALEIENDSPDKQWQRVEYASANNWKARAVQLLELISTKLK